METTTLEYNYGDESFEAFVAWEEDGRTRKPGVLVSHTVRGRTPFEDDKARVLAALGYVGFSLDLYGKRHLDRDPAENRQLMMDLRADRPLLQSRMAEALRRLKLLEQVDTNRVAAIGYCFGGLCVLDLARIGADVSGVASFHGLLVPPGNTKGNRIGAKVLVMHGWDDPLAPPEQVLALADELTGMGADWQIHGYGNTSHAFTNPQAADEDRGLMYQPDADRRSWASLQAFLAELFD